MNATNFDRGNFTQNEDHFITGADKNSTSAFFEEYVGREVPQWVVITYFVTVGIGNCVNFGVIIGLLRCQRKGLLLLILQLSIVDFASTFIAVLEVLSLQKNSWIFSSDLCPLFSGSEVLINSLTLYLIICLNFHIISVWNLHVCQTVKTRKNPSTSCDEDESNECLVKLNESPSSSRTLTIDYRIRSKDVSVIFPSLLVWFTCLSLSVPEYTLSSTIKIKNLSYNSTVCTIVDTYYGQLLQNLLLAFRAAIPIPLILLSFLVMLVKYHRSNRLNLSEENSTAKNLANAKSLMLSCIVLSVLYFITSFPRNTLYIMHVLTLKITGDNLESFKTPPLYNVYVSAYINSFIAMLHYSSTFFRLFVYFSCLPVFRKIFHKKIFACVKRDD